MRLLPLLALLSACAAPYAHGPAFHQAAMRPAPYQPPPAYTPGYAPGTPAEPVYAPVGAGLPGERVPATHAPSTPRSPNKRVLPATGEAGVWAADGEPALSNIPGPGEVPTRLFGVEFPVVGLGPVTQSAMSECAFEMTLAANDARQVAVYDLPDGARECVAIKALQHCVKAMLQENEKRVRVSLPRNFPPKETHRKAEAYLDALAAKWCTPDLTEEQSNVLRTITEKWEWNTTKR